MSYEEYRVYVEDAGKSLVAQSALEPPTAPPPSEDSQTSSKKHLLLIIEDNPELRGFLADRLSDEYEATVADDGLKGEALAFETVPDIIVCDVKMPGKNGLQVASALKADRRTSHIPIVMLTAQSDIEQQISGLQTGADAYLTKPFNLRYLQESLRGLLRNRDRLRAFYALDTLAEAESQKGASAPDRKFIADFNAAIKANVDNSSLNVQMLAEELGLSRMQLYRKGESLVRADGQRLHQRSALENGLPSAQAKQADDR